MPKNILPKNLFYSQNTHTLNGSYVFYNNRTFGTHLIHLAPESDKNVIENRSFNFMPTSRQARYPSTIQSNVQLKRYEII